MRLRIQRDSLEKRWRVFDPVGANNVEVWAGAARTAEVNLMEGACFGLRFDTRCAVPRRLYKARRVEAAR